MEYCERETLRQLIDAGDLHSDEDLVWRLFREIVEGLEHIHSKVCAYVHTYTAVLEKMDQEYQEKALDHS